MKTPRCPKCRNPPRRYVEHMSEFTHTRDADETGRPDIEGINADGNPTHVTAHCACGHQWRLRGIIHMGQVEEMFGIAP